MVGKHCSEHPDDPPLILESDNKTHIAYASCIECDRFLGWVGRKELTQYIYQLQSEINRFDRMLNKHESPHQNN
jgi:hypothetical protein